MKKDGSSISRTLFLGLVPFLTLFWLKSSYAYEWDKTFGGTAYDHGHSVQQTSDGGYIMVGGTNSFSAGDVDVYLIKTDGSGNELWSKTFGGVDYDYGTSVQQTPDGGYIILGDTGVVGKFDLYLVKTDANGNKVWSKTFGGTDEDYSMSGQQTIDGGYIMVGGTNSFGAGGSDVYLVKTDDDGIQQWSKTFGGADDEIGASVQQTADGGFIIAGGANFSIVEKAEAYLIKTDADGIQQWSKTFGQGCTGLSVQQTTDGGFVFLCSPLVISSDGNSDVNLIRTDSSGIELWSKSYGGADNDAGGSLQQTSDRGYIILGNKYSGATSDLYLIKTDANGNQQWSKTFGGSGTELGKMVRNTTDGGLIMVGSTDTFGAGAYDVYLIYYRPNGAIP